MLETLLHLEKGFWEAAGGDGSYCQTYFADDGLMILPFAGGVLDKKQGIDAVRKSGDWNSYAIDSPSLVTISETNVALAYKATGTRSRQADYHALICSVHRRHEDSWQLVLHQQTPIQP